MATKKRKKVGPPSPAVFAAQDAALSSAHTAHTARAASIAAADKHKSAVAQGNARKIASTHKAMRAAMAVSSAADAHSDTLDRARHSTVNADLARRDQSKPKKARAQMRTSFDAETAQLRKAHEAKQGAKHKKIQATVNTHLKSAEQHKQALLNGGATKARRAMSVRQEAAHSRGHVESLKAATALSKQLPQGYAMVFGKLRKITAGKPRTGIAKLKR